MGALAFATHSGAGSSWSAPLLAGDAGTAQTIALIRATVEQGWRDPLVRATAGRLIASLSPSDQEAQARRIFAWVSQNIRFVRDPVGHETVSSPRWTLTHGFGDCDDINAVLLPALLGAVGIHARLVTVGDEENFSHVYAEALLDGRWIPLDAARPNPKFGQGPQNFRRKRIWELISSDVHDVAGLGFDWGGLAQAGVSIGGAIANIFRARGGLPSTPPYGGIPSVTRPDLNYPVQPSYGGGLDQQTLLWIALGFGALMLLRGSR